MLDEAKLKKVLKAAIAETLEERQDLLRTAVVEAIEDLGLIRAIEEGARSKSVSRDEIFGILQRN